MVRKRSPVVSSHGETARPFTQNASWWFTGTLRPLRKDTMDSQDSLVCNRTSQVCLGPSSWQQLNSTGPSAEHSPVPWPAASPQRQPVWPYPPVGACLPPPHCPDCRTLGPAHCSQAPTHPPTHPQPKSATLPLRNFARMGHSSPGLEERSKSGESGGKEVGCSEAPAGFQSS